MAQAYKIKEVTIQLGSGVSLIVEVDSVQTLKELIAELKQEELLNFKPAKKVVERETDEEEETDTSDSSSSDTENPILTIEEKAELPKNSLATKRVLGFKNENPQILRPTSIKSADAIVILLFALEYGLNKQKTTFDDFKILYDGQGIKSGSPLSMTVTNLKNSNYLEKKIYETSRELSLNARGVDKAKEILKEMTK